MLALCKTGIKFAQESTADSISALLLYFLMQPMECFTTSF